MATCDIQEPDGQFYECAIFTHRSGGGHCIWLGEQEYEGLGIDQASGGTYSFVDGVLKDSDGVVIPIKNVARENDGDDNSEGETGGGEEGEEYVSLKKRRRGRGRGGQGRGRHGRGRGGQG